MVEDKKRRMCCSISAFCFFPDQLGGGIFTYQSNYTLNDNCQYASIYISTNWHCAVNQSNYTLNDNCQYASYSKECNSKIDRVVYQGIPHIVENCNQYVHLNSN
jgi:hypothetical protein